MKQLNTDAGTFGPFSTIEILADRARCDGVDYQFSVVGAVSIADYVPEAEAVPVPESVPMLNAELVLIGAGFWDDVQAFVAARGPYALAFLNRAQTMRRDNVLVNAWATARGITEAQLDGLFVSAGNLKVDEFHG